jgi:hypothetical protein
MVRYRRNRVVGGSPFRRAFRASALTRPSGRGPRATLSRWAGEGIEAPIKPVGELRAAVRTTMGGPAGMRGPGLPPDQVGVRPGYVGRVNGPGLRCAPSGLL